MANKKKSKKSTGEVKTTRRERIDRRFLPVPTTAPAVLYALIAVGAASIGVGVYAQFLRPEWSHVDAAPWAFWPLAIGGLLVAAGIWFSTNGDAAVRVGDPGVAEERGGLRRIPWHSLESVRFDDKRAQLLLTGQDELGAAFSFHLNVRAHREAAARLLAEADERVPSVVDVADDVRKDIGPASASAGLRIKEPLQVVGKRCAESGKPIAYEEDARVCRQCERVYHKRHVPKECACGAFLSALQDAMLPKDHEAVEKKTAEG